MSSNNLQILPWEELSKQLELKANYFHSLLLTIQSAFDRNDRNLVIFNLGFRTTNEIERVIKWLTDDNELLAWSTRNIYEIHLILKNVLQSDENLGRWIGQKVNDDKEIIKGFQELRGMFPDEVNEMHDKQLSALDEVSDNLGIEVGRSDRVFDLARIVGKEKEYRLFYKFLSKYIHPTSWIINADPDRVNSNDNRNLLVLLFQVLIARIQNDIETTFELKGKIELKEHKSFRWIATSYDEIPTTELVVLYKSLESELTDISKQWIECFEPTRKDIENLRMFALSHYLVQKFDWKSWPQWQFVAARLYGAAQNLEKSFAIKSSLENNDFHPIFINNLQKDLGKEKFDREYEIGGKLNWTQVKELALFTSPYD